MLNQSATSGVCAACKYDPECIYEADAASMVLQCEQFEMELQPCQPESTRARFSADGAEDRNGFAGLCVNCDNRHTCIYPKPDGGIWHCDEYV